MSDEQGSAPHLDAATADSSEITHERAMAERDRLLREEARHVVRPCAEAVVRRYWRFFAGGFMSLDDLLSLGEIALDDAVRKYREERGHDFVTYARHWVRGAMLNALSVEGFQERVRLAAEKAEAHFGAHYRDDDYDVSRHDGHEGRRRYRAFANGVLAATFSAGLQEAMRALEEDETAERRQYEHALRVLVPAFGQLTDKQRQVLAFVYGEGRDLTETSQTLGIPYVTVRRTHAAALDRLREILLAQGVHRAPRPAVIERPPGMLIAAARPGNDQTTPIGPPKPGAG